VNAPQLRHVAYTSRLAPGRNYGCFGEICRLARAFNGRQGIAGVLLFDGERFFQWLYGPGGPVDALMARIAVDPRHEAVRMHLATETPPLDVVTIWRAGFVDGDALDRFLALRTDGDPLQAFAGIGQLLVHADLDLLSAGATVA